GVFLDRNGRATSGREALAVLARRNTRGPQSAFHFIMNHVIEPSAAGASGKEYLVQLRMGERERPNEIFGGGHYEDVYVRTRDGWRFKQRQFIPSEKGVGSLFPVPRVDEKDSRPLFRPAKAPVKRPARSALAYS